MSGISDRLPRTGIVLLMFIDVSVCIVPAFFNEQGQFQDDINTIKKSIKSFGETFDKFTDIYLTKIEPRLLIFATELANIDSNIRNLQERAHAWDTFQLHVAAWNEQLVVLDRKMDIINKGHEKLLDTEAKVSEITSVQYKADNIAKGIEKIEESLLNVNQKLAALSSEGDGLFNEFTCRGILSTLKVMESKLDSLQLTTVAVNNKSRNTDMNNNCSVLSTRLDQFLGILPQKKDSKKDVTEAVSGGYNLNEHVQLTTTDSSAGVYDHEYPFISSCEDLFAVSESGVYLFGTEQRNGASGRNYNMRYCEVRNDSIWTVIQRRDGAYPYQNFNLSWYDYKFGFGDLHGNFWFGNEFIHLLTLENNVMLRVELEDFEGNTAWAEYENFKVLSESDNYMLVVDNYTGNASDSLSNHNGSYFSTYDKKNDQAPDCCPCAVTFGGGWWFNRCFESNLNGVYHSNPKNNDYYRGLIWEHWLGNYSLKRSQMMIKWSHFTDKSTVFVTSSLYYEDLDP